MTNPAAQQSVVKGKHTENAFQKNGPKVHRSSCTDTDQDSAYDKFDFLVHVLPIKKSNEGSPRRAMRGLTGLAAALLISVWTLQ